MELRYSQSNTERQLSLERIIKTRKKKKTRRRHGNQTHMYILTRQNVLQPLWIVQNISLQQRQDFKVSLASSAIKAVLRHRRQITKNASSAIEAVPQHRRQITKTVTGTQLESRAREETGRFRDIKRCVATWDRTRVSGIGLLHHNRLTNAARYHRTAPQSF